MKPCTRAHTEGQAGADWLWEEFRAAIIVYRRVRTPEVAAEVERAKDALLHAIDTS